METTAVQLLGGHLLRTWCEGDTTIHAQIFDAEGELAHATFTGRDAELTAMVVLMKWAKWSADRVDGAGPVG